MSKVSAFFYSCLIYFLTVFIIVFFYMFFKPNVLNYGNDTVDVLFVEDNEINNNKQQKQDYTKEIAKVVKEDSVKSEEKNKDEKKEINKVEEKKVKKEEINKVEEKDNTLDDLFNDLDIGEVKKKNIKPKTSTKVENKSQSKVDSSSQSNENQKSTTVKSNNNTEDSKTSARVSGIYDPYFGRVNAYLKNIWTLVIAGESGIDDKEIFEISFQISKDGIIKIDNSNFIENTMLRKKARVFVDTVNNQNKNLGIPPNNKDYNGVLRLSVVLNIKEIK
ncbi:hypothetical protein [Campylobacter sp. MG1]|uniref:hypothetical protein n=1 Tax=Campylobacter sp. MG1 TaxID=2976332 RepID=UPI00226CDDB8|nr:hypothetical protein [Campylobacter sp. MG1]